MALGGAAAAAQEPGRPAALARGATGAIEWAFLAAAPLAVGLFLWRRWYRLGAAPRPARVGTPIARLGAFYAILVLGMAGAAIAKLLLPEVPEGAVSDRPLTDLAIILTGHYAAQAVAVAGFLWLIRRAPRAAVPARPPARRAVLAGAGALLLVWPVVQCTAAVGGYVTARVTGEPVELVAHDTLGLLLRSPADGWLALAVLLVVLAAPVLDEVAYRAMLQSALADLWLGRWGAIVVASLVFVLMHVGIARWHALGGLFVLSLSLGWIYERTGRLEAAVTMHVLFNAANLGLGLVAGP